jgi:hypothetical protein
MFVTMKPNILVGFEEWSSKRNTCKEETSREIQA